MIYVSSGHEKGIGLEIFFKSILLYNDSDRSQFTLVANQKAVIQTLKFCHLKFEVTNNEVLIGSRKIKCLFTKEDGKISQSLISLLHCLKLVTPKDILFTLPTSKKELHYKRKNFLGHTEFLRYYYKDSTLSMNFFSPELKILLLTDHLSLKNVSSHLTSKMAGQRVATTLKALKEYFSMPSHVYFSGINPHAGEGGLLGKEDRKIEKAITLLRSQFKKTTFLGPFSADSLHVYFSSENLEQNLFVYAYHDQALAMFKQKSRTLGANITFGLPFLRLSVDHGTAFNLYGKNCADYMGCYYNMNLCLTTNQKINL